MTGTHIVVGGTLIVSVSDISVYDTFGDLPDATTLPINTVALVLQTTGILFINRRRKGLYVSDGSGWNYTNEFGASNVSYDDSSTSVGFNNVQDVIEYIINNKVDNTDPRLTDARTPLAHTHVLADITDFDDSNYVRSNNWTLLVTQYTVAPTVEKVIATGTVLRYEFNSVVRYRFVPTVYDPVEDAFYSNFDSMTDALTGLISRRGA